MQKTGQRVPQSGPDREQRGDLASWNPAPKVREVKTSLPKKANGDTISVKEL